MVWMTAIFNIWSITVRVEGWEEEIFFDHLGHGKNRLQSAIVATPLLRMQSLASLHVIPPVPPREKITSEDNARRAHLKKGIPLRDISTTEETEES